MFDVGRREFITLLVGVAAWPLGARGSGSQYAQSKCPSFHRARPFVMRH